MQATMVSTTCRNCGHSLIRDDTQLPTSPVPELPNVSRVAPLSQVNIVPDTISSALYNISQLDVDIDRIQVVLDKLQRKLVDFQSYTYMYMALIAPIRRLPQKSFLRYSWKQNTLMAGSR